MKWLPSRFFSVKKDEIASYLLQLEEENEACIYVQGEKSANSKRATRSVHDSYVHKINEVYIW